jgi:hypothetical protein
MHGQSSTVHTERLGGGRQVIAVGQDSFPCQCGCGASLGRGSRGKPRRFVLGHQVKRRSIEDWKSRWLSVRDSMPLCECGCGQKVAFTYGQTLDNFILHQGSLSHHRFILGHDKRPAQWSVELTNEERGAVLGTLLGDASIGYPHKGSQNPRLSFNHGGPQEAWARYKAGYLQRLGFHIAQAANRGFGTTTIRCHTRCLPALKEVLYLARPSTGPKKITTELLDSLGGVGLAWWICDDGSASGEYSMSLHTEGYDRESVECAAGWLDKKFGPVGISKGRTIGWTIRLNRDCRDGMRELVSPHIPECMSYKLRVFNHDRKTPRRKGGVRHRSCSPPQLLCQRAACP